MRLYIHPMSANARRATMAALQLGTPIELVTVDLAKGAQRQPEFLKMNPSGKVPVLDDDGFYLTESHAIMQYLAEKTPKQTVYPTETRARADVNRWLFWNAHHFMPAVSILNWENLVKPFLGLGAADPVEVKRGEKLVSDCAKVLDEHLAGKQWVSQDRLTLADLAISTDLMVADQAKLPIAEYKNVHAWLGRVKELDVWKRTSL
ncbi:MAG: glutathione S-transferase family protein [Polyangiaceae bacterium]|nr:glutathione S-transferase family protein [Polyangiaceae bacterium]